MWDMDIGSVSGFAMKHESSVGCGYIVLKQPATTKEFRRMRIE
jgi:hypothetical protein